MVTLDFHEVAHLLNFSRTTNIELTPLKSKDGRWSLFRGTHSVHTSSYPFCVLYFYAAATLGDIKTAFRDTAKYENRHVVYPPTLERFVRRHPDVIPLHEGTKGLWTTREYLVSFIKEEIQTYLRKIADQAPKDYIDPHVQTPSGFQRRIPNPVLSFLQDPQPDAGGKLGIVLAEPGQGKTYMSRFLVSKISEGHKGLVPLMVDSSQWQTISVEDHRSLTKTIAHSFRHFGATIGWLDGHEEEFLRTTLKADVFRIVFDGFDEYILRNRGTVQPMEVLEILASLAMASGTAIVITSRTSFWKANLPEAEVENFLSRSGSLVFEILPFDAEHAKNYFSRKLSPEATNNAVTMYSTLRTANEAFVGRGFVLSLIADLAAEGKITAKREEQIPEPMLWLTEGLCRRETLRQQLPFTAQDQMSIFRIFAVEVAEGALPTDELLELSMGIVHPTLDATSLKSTLEKLKSHPLIERDASMDAWKFKQEQIRILFLAEQIVHWDSERLQRFVVKARLDPESWQDLGTTIVDMVKEEKTTEEPHKRLHELVISMSGIGATHVAHLSVADDGSRLAGIVALAAVERLLPRGSSHAERAELLLRLCGPESITNLNFSGTVARFDFRNVKFERCRFERVAWANCKFDDTSVFSGCQFVGGVVPAHCEGFGSVKTPDCRLDPDAEAIINSERVREGKRKYSAEDLRSDMHSVVHRFIIKGGIGLKTVESSTLLKGPISASRHRDEVVDMLMNTVLEEHRISGSLTGYNVRSEAADSVKFYAANNVFTGLLREAFEKLKQKLELS